MSQPWFRVYNEVLTDRKLDRVSWAYKFPRALVVGAWVMLLALASDSPERGRLLISPGLPLSEEEILAALRLPPARGKVLLKAFIALKMIAWQDGCLVITHWHTRQFTSDTSTERSREFRARQQKVTGRNVAATPPESDTDTESDSYIDMAKDNSRAADLVEPKRRGRVQAEPVQAALQEGGENLSPQPHLPSAMEGPRHGEGEKAAFRPSSPPTLQPSSPPTLPPSNPPALQPSRPPTLQPSNPPTLPPSSPPALPPSIPPAVRVCLDAGLEPAGACWPEISLAVGQEGASLARWQQTVTAWLGAGWNAGNIQGMLDYFERQELPETQKGTRYGAGSVGTTGRGGTGPTRGGAGGRPGLPHLQGPGLPPVRRPGGPSQLWAG